MRPLQFALVATLIAAVVGSGLVPPEHLHPSTATRSQVVHAHWDSAEHAGAHAVFSAYDGDDHAVVLDIGLAVGQTPYAPSQLAVVSHVDWAAAVAATEILSPVPGTAPGPSPPPRPAAPRAPPA